MRDFWNQSSRASGGGLLGFSHSEGSCLSLCNLCTLSFYLVVQNQDPHAPKLFPQFATKRLTILWTYWYTSQMTRGLVRSFSIKSSLGLLPWWKCVSSNGGYARRSIIPRKNPPSKRHNLAKISSLKVVSGPQVELDFLFIGLASNQLQVNRS